MRRYRFWIGLAALTTATVLAGLALNLYRTLSRPQGWAYVPGPCADGAVFTVPGNGCGGEGTAFDAEQVYGPSILKDRTTESAPCPGVPIGATCYRMWYVGTVGEVRQIGYAVSADGLSWQRVPGPLPGGSVLGAGAAEAFDGGGVTMPSVLKEGDVFRMWYAGLNAEHQPNGIGVARSIDGLNWTRETTRPVLPKSGREGVFDRDELPSLSVLKDRAPCMGVSEGGDCYRLWFEGLRTSPDYRFGIGHAVSADGLKWTRVPGDSEDEAVLTAGWLRSYNTRSVGVPFVLKDGALFRMWYEAWGNDGLFSLGYAASADGVRWWRPAPLAAAFSGADDPYAAVPDDVWVARVLKEGVSYRMWYTVSSRPNARRLAVAEMTPGTPLVALNAKRAEQTVTVSFETAQPIPAGGSVLVTLPEGWAAQPESSGGFGREVGWTWERSAVTDAEARGVARGALLLSASSAIAPGAKELRFSVQEPGIARNLPATLYLQTFSTSEVLEYGTVGLP
jgi:hypothetical protein